jgi:8-oxo-dGTP diphosphatase
MKDVAVGIMVRDGLVLACQRKRTMRYPLKWEFPGGKVEPGESPEQTVFRELYEELGIIVEAAYPVHRQEWVYGEGTPDPRRDGSYRVFYFLIPEFTGEPLNRVFEAVQWVTPHELAGMDILEGNRTAIDLLIRHGYAGHIAKRA